MKHFVAVQALQQHEAAQTFADNFLLKTFRSE